jgi:hypothetical protein
MLCSLFWISWPLKMGLTRPRTSVNNHHCTLRNVSERHRSHMMIWQCRPFSCPTTEWLSPWSRFLLEKLTGPQQVKICYTFIEPGGCCIYKSPSLLCILSQMNEVHAFPSWLFKFHSSILPSAVFMEVIQLCLLLMKLHYATPSDFNSNCAFTCVLHVLARTCAILRHVNTKVL